MTKLPPLFPIFLVIMLTVMWVGLPPQSASGEWYSNMKPDENVGQAIADGDVKCSDIPDQLAPSQCPNAVDHSKDASPLAIPVNVESTYPPSINSTTTTSPLVQTVQSNSNNSPSSDSGFSTITLFIGILPIFGVIVFFLRHVLLGSVDNDDYDYSGGKDKYSDPEVLNAKSKIDHHKFQSSLSITNKLMLSFGLMKVKKV